MDARDSARYVRGRILAGAGFNVIDAASGMEALKAVRDAKPDLVLLDFDLPDAGGFEVLRRIKQDPETAPAVILAVPAGFREAEQGISGGAGAADGYVTEPVHPDVLAATARALVRARAAEQRLVQERREAASERESLLRRIAFKRELFQAILAQLPLGVVVAEAPSAKVVYSNGESERLLGIVEEVERVEQYTIVNAVHEDGSPYAPEEYPLARALTRGETIRNEEITVRRRDGSVAVLLASAAPLRREGGGFQGAVVTLHDITNQKLIERALRESEAQFRMLAESIPHAVWVGRPDGTTEYVNRRYLEYTGLDAGQAYLPGSLKSLVHPDDWACFEGAWKAFRETGEIPPLAFRLRRAGGSTYRWQIGRGIAVRDEGGRIYRWFATITDVHDQKAAEESVREAQKFESIGLLAGGIAHDFNNLLTSILGYASLLVEEVPGRLRREVSSIIAAAERAAELTRQLLAYSGRGRFVVEPVDISQVAREMSGLLQASVPKGVSLVQSFAANLPMIEADAGQMQQIIMNLIANAAEAIPPERPGEVTLKTGVASLSAGEVLDHISRAPLPPGRYVYIEVADNGTGIDADILARIFDPFVTTKFAGRGLGLPAVAGIVKAHHGGMHIFSEKDKGSRFTVYLPAARESAAAGPQAAAGKATVLVVDDEAVVRDVAQASLEHAGYRVLTAVDGRDALRILDDVNNEVDVVLLDLTMPLMGGEQTERLLHERLPDIKIILMTGYNEMEARRRFSGARLAGFLQKPFTSSRLAQKVAAVLAGATEWEAA